MKFDMTKFTADLGPRKYQLRSRRMLPTAKTAGVYGTHCFFVN